jgi:transcriptional regulator with XRE-family HTH domain
MAKRRPEDFEDSDEYLTLKRAVGDRIRQLRKARNLSQKQLADLAEISNTNFGVVESGFGNVTLLILDRVAKALGVSITALLEDTPAATTSGIEGVMVRIMSDMDRLRKQCDIRRDELARLTSELQGFIDANREALEAMTKSGELAPNKREKS